MFSAIYIRTKIQMLYIYVVTTTYTDPTNILLTTKFNLTFSNDRLLKSMKGVQFSRIGNILFSSIGKQIMSLFN